MNKFQILGSVLAMTTVLSLGSCASDEPVNSAAGQQSAGTGITFIAERANENAAKKTYYGDASEGQLPVYWSAGDRITIFSPAAGEVADQQGVFNCAINLANGQSATAFIGSDVNWNLSVSTQDFYAYYPASAVEDGKISINSDGSATFAVPADQSSISEQVAATTAAGAPHPLAYAIAATTDVLVDEESSVGMAFNDFMNVLRLKINNDKGYTINSVVISSATAGQNVAGTIQVTPTDVGGSTTCVFGSVSSGNASITLTPGNSAAAELVFNVYLLPLNYTNGITIKVNYMDEGEAKDFERTTLPFTASTIKDVLLNMPIVVPPPPVYTKVDMGILVRSELVDNAVITRAIATFDKSLVWVVELDGSVSQNLNTENSTPEQRATALGSATPLYFAEGNLLLDDEYSDNVTASIYPVTASTTISVSGGYGVNSYNRGFFQWSIASGEWKGESHTAINNTHISGNPDYDIARNKLVGPTATGKSGWRLPTAVEWAFLMEMNTIIDASSMYDSWSKIGNSYTNSYAEGYHNQSRNWKNGVLTVTGVNGAKLYLPLMGSMTDYDIVIGVGGASDYSSGTSKNITSSRLGVCGVLIYSWYWVLSALDQKSGAVVRPVTE